MLLLCAIGGARCWGPKGHTLITEHAIQLLPPGLKPFYNANSRYLVALTNLPDDWRDYHKAEAGPWHYIDLDLLGAPPFTDLIADRATVEKKLGKDKILKAGVLPWEIVARYNKLVKAFKTMDTVDVVVQSAVLSHLIGDAHVPFHATKFYDGKNPEQKGVHYRWEEILVELAVKPESIAPAQPEAVDNILKSAFGWCISSYTHLDDILNAEDKAHQADSVRGYNYYKVMLDDTGGILTGQISHASQAAAGVFIAAWKEAGKPAMPEKCAPLFWGR